MADSDSSALSSAPSTDDEAMTLKMTKPTGLDRYFKAAPKPAKEPTPEPPKRAPSPPHEYTLADNEGIAFLVMFRSRFSDAFPKSLPHYGPQDIERGVENGLPDEQVERLLCALLGLVLNRKKDVERGHYGRALEDAISTNQYQWPQAWQGANPLHGGKNFNNMSPEERLVLLKTLALWSLNSSDAISAILKESYKQTRRDDDKNQPRSVQPWFSDAYRRKYWLVEGLEDSHFRVYRENDGKTSKTNTWFSIAGSIEDINALADKFVEENTTNSKIISDKLRSAVPRFETGEEKRRRRDYRLARKAAFSRPEPGFSLYEGRTRGKRMKYTFSDEEDGSDVLSSRRSRNSGMSTPLEAGPTVTASGRHVKSRLGGLYGESMLIDQRKELEKDSEEINGIETGDDMPGTAPNGRSMRGGRATRIARDARDTRENYNANSDSDADEAQSSGNEWSGNEDEPDDDSEPDFDGEDDDEEDLSDQGMGPDDLGDGDNTQESLVVQLRYRKGTNPFQNTETTPSQPVENGGEGSVSNSVVHIEDSSAKKSSSPSMAFITVPAHVEKPNHSQLHESIQPATSGGESDVSDTTDVRNGMSHQVQHQPQPQLQAMDVS